MWVFISLKLNMFLFGDSNISHSSCSVLHIDISYKRRDFIDDIVPFINYLQLLYA